MEVFLTNLPMPVSLSASGSNIPFSSRSLVMVLNLTILKIRSFNPGRFWKKKGFPLFAIANKITTINRMGLKTTNAVKAIKKSIMFLKNLLYIPEFSLLFPIKIYSKNKEISHLEIIFSKANKNISYRL
jgi:hypothetical protein